ncbi:MAG: hypothetical protein LUD12_10175 [Lachnospiraceae bacterium]|nr:hypothetical protein [Lachnospiraceae bacterium]
MLDILLETSGDERWDLDITEDGDIQLTDSELQNVLVALQWIYDEWRLGPDLGFPWYEEVLVKNPNTELIRQEILETILEVDGITEANVEMLEYSPRERKISFSFTCKAGEETYEEEVTWVG